VLLVTLLLALAAVIMWFFVLRDADRASAGSAGRTGEVVAAGHSQSDPTGRATCLLR
jgi:hypothetical protein